MRRVRTWLAVAACCAAMAGCADDRTAAPTEETTVDPTAPSTPTPGAGSGVDASVADLSASLGVDPSDIEVVGVEEVTWRNGSRGCAKPGDSYLQALIDGSRITLRVAGTTYEYHSGGSQPPALCEEPTE